MSNVDPVQSLDPDNIRVTDSSGGTASSTGAIAALTNTNALTDNTGGTASSSAIANLADGSTYANDHAALENNLATIAAELATQRTFNATLMNNIATLADRLNATIGE